MKVVRVIAVLLILLLALFVALSPSVVYAPTPQVVLYFLISILAGILIGGEAVSRFQLKLQGFLFTTTGACAVACGSMLLLTHLSKPQEKIAVFQVYDERGADVSLEWKGALEVPLTPSGLPVAWFASGNTLMMIFPEQVGAAELRIRKSSQGNAYSGMVSYAGSRRARLELGKDLK